VLPLAQVADLTGVYGLSFCVAATNAAVAELWSAKGRLARTLLVPVVVVFAALGYGTWRLQTEIASETPIAVVQGDLPVSGQWSPEHYGRNLDAYLRLTADALRDGPRLVIWPESAMTFFIEREPLYRNTIAAALAPGGAQLVAGGPRDAGDENRFFNSVFLLDAHGAVTAVYDKRRLLPFGEYFPLGTASLVRRGFSRVREFVPGSPSPPLATAAGPAGVLVCNEALFPEGAAERVAEGAGYLLALTNDSWVGEERFAAIALAMTRLRAIEQRRWLVRASTWGPSAIIDPQGRVVAASPMGASAILTGTVASRAGTTPYGRFGDVFAAACVVAVLVALARPTKG
jgi:apolipoprotein N-acyltransferase